MIKVFVINGKPGAGKDAFINAIKSNKFGTYIWNISSIDPVKKACEVLMPNGDKADPNFRDLLASIKRLWVDYNDGPTKYLENKILSIRDEAMDTGMHWIFVHIREPEEIDKLCSRLIKHTIPYKTIYVQRDVEVKSTNDADNSTGMHVYDITIVNDRGIGNLVDVARDFIKEQGECIQEEIKYSE